MDQRNHGGVFKQYETHCYTDEYSHGAEFVEERCRLIFFLGLNRKGVDPSWLACSYSTQFSAQMQYPCIEMLCWHRVTSNIQLMFSYLPPLTRALPLDPSIPPECAPRRAPPHRWQQPLHQGQLLSPRPPLALRPPPGRCALAPGPARLAVPLSPSRSRCSSGAWRLPAGAYRGAAVKTPRRPRALPPSAPGQRWPASLRAAAAAAATRGWRWARTPPTPTRRW